MSAEATGWVWKNSPYRGAELLVHLAMADVVNDAHDNEFWMSTYGLARKAHVSQATVKRTLKHMLEAGHLLLLESNAAIHKPCRYRMMTGVTTTLAGVTTTLALVSSGPQTGVTTTHVTKRTEIELKSLANPECFDCHGEGTAYHPGAGRDARCHCTKEAAGGNC